MATDGPTVQPGQPGSKVLDPHDQPPPTWAYLDASDVLRQLDERDARRRRPTVPPVLRISDRYLVGTLDLRGMRLPYALEFVRCRFEQAPDLRQASLPGVTFTGCWLPGLEARNLQSSGDVALSSGTTSAGAVNLTDADIAGFLLLGGSRLLHSDKIALCADRIRVGGDVQAANIFVEGQVSLGNAQIGGSLDARESRIDGILRLAAAHVHGDMIFDDGIINSPERTAIDGARLTIGGGVSARNLAAAGSILLPGAKIGTDLDLANSRIRSSPASPRSVDLRAASIGRATYFSGAQLSGGLGTIALDALGLVTSELRLAVVAPPIGRVNLWHARCQVLADNKWFWDTPGAIDLDDFRYERLAEPIDPTDDAQVSRRLRWLRQGMRDHYRPDPYDQLARALRASGNEKHSATVLMVK